MDNSFNPTNLGPIAAPASESTATATPTTNQSVAPVAATNSVSPFQPTRHYGAPSTSGFSKQLFVPDFYNVKHNGKTGDLAENQFDLVLKTKRGEMTYEQSVEKAKTFTDTKSLVTEMPEGVAIKASLTPFVKQNLFASAFGNEDFASLTIQVNYDLDINTWTAVGLDAAKQAFAQATNAELDILKQKYGIEQFDEVTKASKGFKPVAPFHASQKVANLVFAPELKTIAEAQAMVAANKDLTFTQVDETRAFVFNKMAKNFNKLATLEQIVNPTLTESQAKTEGSNFVDCIVEKVVSFLSVNALTKDNVKDLRVKTDEVINTFNGLAEGKSGIGFISIKRMATGKYCYADVSLTQK